MNTLLAILPWTTAIALFLSVVFLLNAKRRISTLLIVAAVMTVLFTGVAMVFAVNQQQKLQQTLILLEQPETQIRQEGNEILAERKSEVTILGKNVERVQSETISVNQLFRLQDIQNGNVTIQAEQPKWLSAKELWHLTTQGLTKYQIFFLTFGCSFGLVIGILATYFFWTSDEFNEFPIICGGLFVFLIFVLVLGIGNFNLASTMDFWNVATQSTSHLEVKDDQIIASLTIPITVTRYQDSQTFNLTYRTIQAPFEAVQRTQAQNQELAATLQNKLIAKR